MAILLVALQGSATANDEIIRLRDINQHVGHEVTVKARTGTIEEAQEKPGIRAFTVRDDYGDMVVVNTALEYPIFGATYFITGVPNRGAASSHIILQETSRRKAFSTAPPWLLPAVAAVVIAGVLAVGLIIKRRGAGLPTAWGFAEVTAGPDQGKSFALRGDRIIVGRGHDPTLTVSLVVDDKVSRTHGLIIRKGEEVFYEDTNSSNGSRIDGTVALAGEQVALEPGAEIQLGMHTKLRVGSPGNAMETQVPGMTTGSWGEPEPGETQGI